MKNEKTKPTVAYKEREHVQGAESSVNIAVTKLMALSDWKTPEQSELRSRLLKVQKDLQEMLR